MSSVAENRPTLGIVAAGQRQPPGSKPPTMRPASVPTTEHQLDVSNALALVVALFPEADERLGGATLGAVVGLVVTYMEQATEARQA